MVSWDFKTQSYQPIGLDIGHNSIKMIQLKEDAGNISVIAADKVQIDPALNEDPKAKRDFILYAIKQMLAHGGFHGRRVVSCLSSDLLKITSLRLAESETGEIEQLLKKEVGQRFGLDPETDSINYIFAGNVRDGDETKNELILFAAEDTAIKEHISLLEEARLFPVAIDTHPCALFRSFERWMRRQEDRDRTGVFIDVGGRYTTVVFGCRGQINFIKQIPIGAENFTEQVAAKLGIGFDEASSLRSRLRVERSQLDEQDLPSWADSEGATSPESLDSSTRQAIVDAVTTVVNDLAKEISLCFRYYTVTFRGKRVERAILSGGGAYEEILVGILDRLLSVDLEVAQPLKGFDLDNAGFDSDRRGLLCEWAVAVGLSLKGLNTEN